MLEEQEAKEEAIEKLKLRKLRAEESGQKKLEQQLQKKIDAEERALEIAKEHNITLAEAQDLVRGLIKQEEKEAGLETTKGLTGKDKSGSNLLQIANKLGKDKDISFQRESTSRGSFFRKFVDGEKQGLLTKEQLQESVGKKLNEMEASGSDEELDLLAEIRDAMKAKTVSE